MERHWYTRVPGIQLAAGVPASRFFTWMADGFTITLPSGKTTVGTVWLPPLTLITYSAAAGSRSMSTSVISIPSRASWALSRLQNAHHWVVYMVSGADT